MAVDVSQPLSSQIGNHKTYIVGRKNIKPEAQYELDKWQAEFDYEYEMNSPTRQLQRLYDAQINPLFDSQYGGQINHGDASIGTPPDSLGALTGIGSNLNQIAQTATQRDLTNSQIELNQSAGALNRATARKAGSESTLNEIRSKTQFDRDAAELQNMFKSGKLTDTQTSEIRAKMSQMGAYLRNDTNRTLSEMVQALSSYENAISSRMSAVSDIQNAATNAGELQVHRGQLKLDYANFGLSLDKFNFEKVDKMINSGISQIMGVKFTTTEDMRSIVKLYSDFSKFVDGSLTPEEINKSFGDKHISDEINPQKINENIVNKLQNIGDASARLQLMFMLGISKFNPFAGSNDNPQFEGNSLSDGEETFQGNIWDKTGALPHGE